MTVLFTLLAVVLLIPVLLVVAIALGPAILVMLFIGGIALVVIALAWTVERAHSRHARRKGIPPVHT